MYSFHPNSYANIAAAATTQVVTGRGILHTIVINSTANGTIKIIDGTSGTTANIATLKASIPEGTYTFDINFTKGLRIISAADTDFTVTYTK